MRKETAQNIIRRNRQSKTPAYVAGLDAVASIAWTTATTNSLAFARDAFHRLTTVSAGSSPVCTYTLDAKDRRIAAALAGI